jgi:hypothetical protein
LVDDEEPNPRKDFLMSVLQRPRKHFESGGALANRGTFVYDQNQTMLCRSRAERKILKIWSLYDVGNGLYRVLYRLRWLGEWAGFTNYVRFPVISVT